MKPQDETIELPAFLARLRVRDAAAFRTLVTHFHKRLLGFAGTLVGRAAAEDVVQEAWISIWRNLPEFQGRASLKTWIYTIVRNECIARLRRDSRLHTVSIAAELHDDGVDGWLAANFAQDGHWQRGPAHWHLATPESLLEESQLLACLEHHIAGLQQMQRAVFRLRDMEQLEMEEICNILEISASNARVLLHRARLALLQVIDRYQQTGEC